MVLSAREVAIATSQSVIREQNIHGIGEYGE